MRVTSDLILSKEPIDGRCPVLMVEPDKGRPCGRPLLLGDGKVCICHSTQPKDVAAFQVEIKTMLEQGDRDFSQFVFPDGFDFSHQVLAGPSCWDGAHFLGEARFYETTFEGRASFSCIPDDGRLRLVVFHGPAFFVGSIFKDMAFFAAPEFRTRATFAWAAFHTVAAFTGYWGRDTAETFVPKFLGEADFRLARFGNLFLPAAEFRGRADFAQCRVFGNCTLESASFASDAHFFGEFHVARNGGTCAMTALRLEQPQRVRFIGTDFSRTFLAGTDIANVRLVNVVWPRRNDGSCAAWDELSPKPAEKSGSAKESTEESDSPDKRTEKSESPTEKLSRLGELYRQLKVNYEGMKRWDIAGDFHIGEMEARRALLGSKIPLLQALKRHVSLLGLYRHISLYGEDYRRAGGWVVFIPLMFFLFYLGLAGWPAEASRIEAVAFFSIGQCLHLKEAGSPGWLFPATVRWLGAAEGVLFPTIAALFAIAVRRRFQR